jgi:hypothetical protein
MFWYPSPDLCLDTILFRRSTGNSFNLMACFFLWHALSIVGPYIDRCVPFQIMSNQFNLPQVDSNQVVETSQGWSMEDEPSNKTMSLSTQPRQHRSGFGTRFWMFLSCLARAWNWTWSNISGETWK